MKITNHSLTSTQQTEFEDLAQRLRTESGYKWLSSDDLPTAIPRSLRDKIPSALLMWDRTATGGTFIVCNGIRLDDKDDALDQHPFGLAILSSGASTAGIFIDHGNWSGRTIPITPDVRQVLESTSLGRYFPLGEVPQASSGPLSDLSGTSHEGAFRAVIRNLLSGSTG
jgi:hypothetical protein